MLESIITKGMPLMNFHGSYSPNDVTFLLKPLDTVEDLPLREKEHNIQQGNCHYSEMLTPEKLPSPEYLALFNEALRNNGARMAQDCAVLALHIKTETETPILVSLARAGTPVGVVIKHLLEEQLSHNIPHYSISIIRDRGIDTNALDAILQRHGGDGSNIIFIDGWTGKGVITRELSTAVTNYNRNRGTAIQPRIYVLSDLAGVAWKCASYDDYLIPSSILNATVSGLVSRSVLNHQIGEKDFHGCLFYREFIAEDRSHDFVSTLLLHARKQPLPAIPLYDETRKELQCAKMQKFMEEERARYSINDDNLIKPGIGEATRVLLRRLPEKVIVQDANDINVRHIIELAREKSVPVELRANLPFSAVSIIKSAL